MRVVRWPRSPAAVFEDGAELGQFEDGGVDPAAFEEWRFAEERDRQGGERDDFAGSDVFGADEALEFALDRGGIPGQPLDYILVVVGLELDVAPLSEGSGIAEGVPGSDLVGECGPRCGGGVGIERICGAAGVVGQLEVEDQAGKFAPEEVDGRHSHAKLLGDTFVNAPMELPEKDDMALGVVNGSLDGVRSLAPHGLFHGAPRLSGHTCERELGLGRVSEALRVIQQRRYVGGLLQPAEDDVGGREMVAEVVDAFVERFQLREDSGGVSISAGSTSKGDDGSGERSLRAASRSAMRRSSSPVSSSLAATPAALRMALARAMVDSMPRSSKVMASTTRWMSSAERRPSARS